MLADEEHDGQGQTNPGRGHQAVAHSHNDHGGNHAKIEHRAALFEQVEARTIEHAEGDDDENASESGDGHPPQKPAQHQKHRQREHTLKHSRQARGSAAAQVDQGGAHGPGPRHATHQRRNDVAGALADQFAIRAVPAARERVHHYTGLERVDGEQGGEGERRHQ